MLSEEEGGEQGLLSNTNGLSTKILTKNFKADSEDNGWSGDGNYEGHSSKKRRTSGDETT